MAIALERDVESPRDLVKFRKNRVVLYMIVLNIMMSRGRGGLENVLVDYTVALAREGMTVHTVTNVKAHINTVLDTLELDNIHSHFLPNFFSNYDLVFVYFYKKLLNKIKPDVIICHGNRALRLNYLANDQHIPTISVSHTYWLKHVFKADHWIALSQDLKKMIIKNGFPERNITLMHNMIEVVEHRVTLKDKFSTEPVIGIYGRLKAVKGFDILIHAITILKAEGIHVKLKLGGQGQEERKLRAIVAQNNLEQDVEFLGWITDKEAFFSSIDVFCVPSRSESFGIVLLEAFMYKRVVIASNIEGPKEIINNGVDGILFESENPQQLALEIKRLLQNPEKAATITINAYQKLLDKFDIKLVGKKLRLILDEVVKEHATK